MRVLVPLFLFLHIASSVFSQSPIARGLNSAGLADTSVWAALSNPSRNIQSGAFRAGISAQNHYFLPELNTYTVATVYPVRSIFLSADMSYHGFSVWQEKTVGISAALPLSEKLALAPKCSFMHVSHGDEYSADMFFLPSIYLSYRLSDYTEVFSSVNGGHFLYDQTAPSSTNTFALGGAYYFSDKFHGTADMRYNEVGKLKYAVSAEYMFVSQFTLRGGVSPGDEPFAGGVTLLLDGFAFDASASYHRFLGTLLSAGIRYNVPQRH